MTKNIISSANCGNTAIEIIPTLGIKGYSESRKLKYRQSFLLRRKSELNKIITNADGSPDYLAINIYYDTLRSWYNPKKVYNQDGSITSISKLKTKGIYFSYKKLTQQHGASSETIRKKLVKLEKLGLIQRSFEHRSNAVTNSYNQLIIYVWKDTPHFFNDFGINKDDITKLVPQTNYEYISKKHDIDYSSKNLSNKGIESRGGIHKLEDTKKLMEPFSNEKDRSNQSIFISSSFLEKKKNDIKQKTLNTNTSHKRPKTLSEFYPIKEEDCVLLQSLSGRDFGITAMNEILKDMSKRLTDKIFYSKKGFISYMSKAFKYELRDTVKTNNETFKIKANYSEEENNIYKQEKYLTEIEYSQQVSPEWHLKKKLAAVLRREIAYEILSNYKKSERVGDIFRFYFAKQLQIGKMDKQIILNQVRAIQERVGDNGGIESIEKIEFNFDKKRSFNTVSRNEKGESEKLAGIKNKEKIKKLPIWFQIRKYFIDYCFDIEEGIGRDKSWLSELKADKDDKNKTLTLTAENNFISDWINSNYLFKLKSIAKELGYQLYLQNC